MWLTETPWPAVVVLLVAAIAFAFLWSRSGRRAFAVAAAVCLLLAPVAYVVEESIVTPAEEVEMKVHALRDAVVAGEVEKVLSFISPTDEVDRARVTLAMNLADVKDDLRITDLSVVTLGEDTQAVSHFRANGTVVPQGFGDQHIPTRWEVSWRKEAGDLKVYKIVRLNPINGEPIGLTSAD